MARSTLAESRIHPSIRQTVSDHHTEVVREVEAAVARYDIVIVGMAMNPFPRKARRALDAIGLPYKYLEYGSYFGEWRRRNALKMWSGWPTLPMIFVKGMLVGGADDLTKLIASGELKKMIGGATARSDPDERGTAGNVVGAGGEVTGASAKTPPTAGAVGAAGTLAQAFLAAMERRDLAAARQYLAPDFRMCFPGGAEMQSLEELVARSAKRYRTVAKDFERVDESVGSDGTVVHCSGRLHGVWTDGRKFSGIRFIDRFEVVDGLIRRQDVWNDMGERQASSGGRRAGPA